MDLNQDNIKKIIVYTDKWGGRNYGCYPINTPGEDLFKHLEKSAKWEMVRNEHKVIECNDNRPDIDRGADYVFKDKNNRTINVVLSKSRSEKTREWKFSCNFDFSNTSSWFE